MSKDTSTLEGRGHGPTGNRSSNQSLERLGVNLTPRSVRALEESIEISGDSKTDVVNRALQVYDFLMKTVSADGAVYIRSAEGAELERVRFF